MTDNTSNLEGVISAPDEATASTWEQAFRNYYLETFKRAFDSHCKRRLAMLSDSPESPILTDKDAGKD